MKKRLAASLLLLAAALPAAPKPAKRVVESPDADYLRKADNTVGKFRYAEGTPFDGWAAAARAALVRQLGIAEKLAAPRVPLAPKVIWSRKVPKGTVTRLLLQSEKDYAMPVYLCLPEGEGPFPVWICVQGHGSGMHVSIGVQWQDETTPWAEDGDRDFALQCLEKGYAALCIEQRALGAKSTFSDQRPSCPRQGYHALMFGETLLGNRVFDIDRGIDFIYSRKELRHDKIGVVGNSGGGTASLYSGAILKRLTHVMPSSCFSTYRDSVLSVYHCICNYWPGMMNWGEMGDLAGLCAPKYLVIVNGAKDRSFPVGPAKAEFERARRIYRAAGVPERCRMVVGAAGHRFYKQDAWPVMDEFFADAPGKQPK